MGISLCGHIGQSFMGVAIFHYHHVSNVSNVLDAIEYRNKGLATCEAPFPVSLQTVAAGFAVFTTLAQNAAAPVTCLRMRPRRLNICTFDVTRLQWDMRVDDKELP